MIAFSMTGLGSVGTNNVSSEAGQDLTFGVGTGGTAITITNSTKIVTLVSGAVASYFSSTSGNAWLNSRSAITGYAQIIYLTAGVGGQQWATGKRAGDNKFHLYDNTAGVDVQTWDFSTGDAVLRGSQTLNGHLMTLSGKNHGVGGSPSINSLLYLSGDFDPTPYSGTEAIGQHLVTRLIPPTTAQAHGVVIQPIYRKSTTGTHDLFTNLKIDQMRFDVGAGAVAECTGIWVSGPTQGTVNYSIHSANGVIKSDDTTEATASGDASIVTDGGIYAGKAIVNGGIRVVSTDTLSGAGAVSLTKDTTKLTSTGVLQSITLADGVEGQIKRIIHDVVGGSMVLTATTQTGWATAIFTNAGDSLTMEFITTHGWIVVGVYGAVVV